MIINIISLCLAAQRNSDLNAKKKATSLSQKTNNQTNKQKGRRRKKRERKMAYKMNSVEVQCCEEVLDY